MITVTPRPAERDLAPGRAWRDPTPHDVTDDAHLLCLTQ